MDEDITVPTGTVVTASLETQSSRLSFDSIYWYSLTETTVFATRAVGSTFNSTANIAEVTLFIADLRRSGSYILCVRSEMDFCGEPVNVTVSVPTLTISTDFLVLQYRGNILVSDISPIIFCSPSDSRAPVRWRGINTTFPFLPSDLQATLTEMGQILILPQRYRISPPDYTIFLICDLQGDRVNGEEISPQRILIRFIQSPVSILYQDREIQVPESLINYLPAIPNVKETALLLACISAHTQNNLRWKVANSPYMNESMELSGSSSVNVTYSDIAAQQRFVSLSITPFTSDNFGKYTCISGQTNYSASVVVTTQDPVFELISPGMEYYPIGATVNTLTVRYGDRSVGYSQLGHGFNFTLTFLPCVEGQPTNVLIGHMITLRNQSTVDFIFSARSTDSGEYLWNATHIDNGSRYLVSKNITITTPIFVELDSTVFVQPRVNVTLKCVPNDTRSPVIWSIPMFETSDLRSFPNNYLFFPPGLDHIITFNSSVLFGSSSFPNSEIQPNVRIGCGFMDGNVRLSLYTQYTTLYVQRGRIEVQNLLRRNNLVRNNSVINAFSFGDRMRRDSSEDYVYESAPEEGQIIGQLQLECRGVQGDHEVSWYTDNSVVGLANGLVNCDRDRFNRQELISNYSSRLVFRNLNSRINGNYTCRSSISDYFFTVEVITINPYIRRLSPAVISVDSGDTVVLGFRFIVNSYGDQLSNEEINVVFNSSAGISFRRFQSNSSQPYDYYLIISSATESDSGVYTARAFSRFCDYEIQDACEIVTESIILIVTNYCEQQVANGFVWPRTLQDNTVALSCQLAGDSFRTETMATRRCLTGGIWNEPDLSTCTLKQDIGSFLLVWFVLNMGTVPNEEESKVLEENLKQELELFNLSVSSVRLRSAITASVSLSFEVTLSSSLSEQNQALASFMNYLNNNFQNFTGVDVQQDNRGLIGVSSTDSCPCVGINSNSSNSSFIELCGGAPSSPCSCSGLTCQCMAPFVGDGNFCTIDTDDDSFPDNPLQSPTCSDAATSSTSFCMQDNCREISNQDQNPMACETPEEIRSNNPEFDGCLLEVDSTWQVLWPNTPRSTISIQQCPGGLESLGKASRECSSSGVWLEPNVLSCESVQFALLRAQANQAFLSSDPQVIIAQVAIITEELIRATAAPTTRTSTSSLLPLDIQTTVNLITEIVAAIENYKISTGTTENVINIFNNILDVNHTIGWDTLGKMQSLNGSELLLFNAERYSMTLANSQFVNGVPLRLSRANIAISAGAFNLSREVNEDFLKFPVEEDLSNFTIGFIPVISNVPREIFDIAEKANASIPVSHILFKNLDTYLQSSALSSKSINVASVVYSIQLGDISYMSLQQVLEEHPLSLDFTFDKDESVGSYNCVFWEFSEPIGRGGFITDGVTTQSNSTKNNMTTVNCLSNHLTSFAVLVDVAGVIPSPGERLGLQIVSYVGCVISIICLTLSVIFFISLRKKLLDSINYFVHLNLSITLLMAFIVFTLGIELGANYKGSCLFVALLLHYLFLSAFCWMLSEGIVLYFLLVDIFNKKGNKWWIYVLIGYVAPIPVVVISVASRYEYYGVKDSDGNLIYCWLSVERGTIFAFVAPMIAIIIINVIFLVLGLHSLYKNRRRNRSSYRKGENNTFERVKSLFMASIVLVPLLGLTWAFGILTINANATVFAWLFTILNSFQGLAIFFFHVIRNEKIWKKLVGPRRKSKKRVTSGAKWYSQTGSTGRGTYFKSQNANSEYRLSSVSGDTMKKNISDNNIVVDENKVDLSMVESAENTKSIAKESPKNEPTQNTLEEEKDSNEVMVNMSLQPIHDSCNGLSDLKNNSISGDATLMTNENADTASMGSTIDSEDYHISKL